MQEIDIKLRPSALFNIMVVLVLIMSMLIICYLSIAIGLKAALATVVLFCGVSIVWKHGLLRNKNAIVKLSLSPQGWELHNRSSILPVNLRGDSTVTTWLSVLRFNRVDQKGKYSVILFRDAIEQNVYRRLIVLLRTTKIVTGSKIR